MSADDLSPKQLRFVDEYLISLNATEAAQKAGYGVKGAHVQGHRLLSNAKISAEIAKRQAKVAAKYAVTQERIVEEYAKLAFVNMADFMQTGDDGQPHLNWANLTRDQAAALAEVTTESFVDARTGERDAEKGRQVRRVKFKLADKRAALADLAKHMQMFIEKHEHSGNLSLTVETGVPRGDAES